MTDLIFDGSSIFARAYFAAQRSASNEAFSDDPVQDAVAIGVKMILNILDPYSTRLGKKVDRILFCWDGKPKREKRRETPKPEDYDVVLKKFIQATKDLFGAAHILAPDHEADDAVATAVYQAGKDTEIFVVSNDKDLQQLVSDNVNYYCLREGGVLSRAFILDKWKVKRPCQICIALAILGDKGDNIEGVKGHGPKAVERLFGHVTPDMELDEALKVVQDQLPHPLWPIFEESLNLTVLDPDVPGVPLPLPLSFASPELLTALGFDSLMGRYLQVSDAYSGNTEARAMEVIDDY